MRNWLFILSICLWVFEGFAISQNPNQCYFGSNSASYSGNFLCNSITYTDFLRVQTNSSVQNISFFGDINTYFEISNTNSVTFKVDRSPSGYPTGGARTYKVYYTSNVNSSLELLSTNSYPTFGTDISVNTTNAGLYKIQFYQVSPCGVPETATYSTVLLYKVYTPIIQFNYQCGNNGGSLELINPNGSSVRWFKDGDDLGSTTTSINISNDQTTHTYKALIGGCFFSNEISPCFFPYAISESSFTNTRFTYCLNDSPELLLANPTGGQFQIQGGGAGITTTLVNGVTNYYFNPSLAGTGTKTITYTFNQAGGNCACPNSAAKIFTVISNPPTPTINGTSICGVNTNTISLSDQTNFNVEWYKDNLALNKFGPTLVLTSPQDNSYHNYKAKLLSYANGCSMGSPSFTNEISICLFPYSSFEISNLKDIYCPGDAASTLLASPSGGLFDVDGTVITSGVFNPANYSSGEHTVTYTYTENLSCNCPNNVKKKVYVSPAPVYLNSVLAASATRLSDNWSIDPSNTSSLQTLANMGSFPANFKGVWKGSESFVYVTERKQSSPAVNIKEDGVFDQFEVFDHDNGAMENCFYKWRKVTTITQYDNNSNESENKDINGIYSAALFGYNGDLATAVAANANQNEFGFISFEEMPSGQAITPSMSVTGNIVFSSSANVTSGSKNLLLDVSTASDNVLVVEAPYSVTSALSSKEIRVQGSYLMGYSKQAIHGIYKVASVSAHNDPKKSIVTLTSSDLSGVWKGRISTQLTQQSPVFLPGTLIQVDATKKHTGKKSLKTQGTVEAEQYKMAINSPQYVVSAWVSAGTSNPNGFKNGTRGIKLKFYLSAGAPVETFLQPEGFVIDGWQRIEGVVTVPANAVRMSLVLQSGTEISWWDDIRIFPADGNIKTFVYNPDNYLLQATLDENNYATFYYYNPEGSLFLVKQETERGVMTIQESQSHTAELK